MRPNNLTLVKVKMSYNKPRLDYLQKVIALLFVIAIAYMCSSMSNTVTLSRSVSISPMFSSTLNNERFALEETTTDSTYETPNDFVTLDSNRLNEITSDGISPLCSVTTELMFGTLNLSEEIVDVDSYINIDELSNPLNYYEFKTGWTSARVNVRDGAGLDTNIYSVKDFNRKIEYASYNKNWAIIKYDEGKNGFAFMHKSCISETKPDHEIKSAPLPNRKSYMYYQAITDTSSKQYRLQMRAHTNSEGLRMLNGRYMIALGSRYSVNIGQYVDLVLDNGTIIECILGDAKSDRHTDVTNSIALDGSVAEFIVDTNLNSASKYRGDASYSYEGWDSPVAKVIVYDKII